MSRKKFFIFLILIILPALSPAVNQNDIVKRVNRLDQVPVEELEDSVSTIIDDLYAFEKPFGKKIIEQLLDITKGKNERAYVGCLNGYSAFNTEHTLSILDLVYHYAIQNGLDDYKIKYYQNKSKYFRGNQQLDSAMIYILRARDLAKSTDVVSYIAVLHQLGDLYYSVALFDKAESYYKLADSLLEKPTSREMWRKRVVKNDLGLIEYERENYTKTLAVFKEAEAAIPFPLSMFSDSLAVCYYRRIIANCLFKLGNYQEALKNIRFSYEVADKYQVKDQLFLSYLTLIRLFIKTDDKEAVVRYKKEFQQVFDNQIFSAEFRIMYMLLNAEIFDYLGDKARALDYYKIYSNLNDSFAIQLKMAGLMQLQAEKDYEKLENDYRQVKNERKYLLIIIGLLLALGLLIFGRFKKISRLNQQLIKTNRTKDKLFSIISHDLKGPFNSLMGFSQILSESINQKDYKQIEESSKIINQSSSELYSMVTNLLDWSRSQRKSLKFVPENIDISDCISKVIAVHAPMSKTKNIKIDSNGVGSYTVYADKNSVTTIFSNLLSNAIKFTPEKGTISFTTKLLKDKLSILITDTGIGIPVKKIPCLFDIRYNESTRGTNQEKGTGLGLLICKEFVEENGGEIKVSSREGGGTTFEVRLKLA